MVIQPLSKEASIYYGKGTRWCISATKDKNYFDQYEDEGTEFIFIIDKKNNDKYAIVYGGNGEENNSITDVFDSLDNKQNEEWLLEIIPNDVAIAIDNFLGKGTLVFDKQMFINDIVNQLNENAIHQFIKTANDNEINEVFEKITDENEEIYKKLHTQKPKLLSMLIKYIRMRIGYKFYNFNKTVIEER